MIFPFPGNPTSGYGAGCADLRRSILAFASAVLLAAITVQSVAAQEARGIGAVTKQPIPRFVSLKPSDTPMREGPSKDHRIKWVFKREGLPVEVIAEHDQWRRVRDSESTDGWVYYGRLSNRRTVIVLAGKETKERELFARDAEGSAVIAKLQPGVIANVENCSPDWCKVSVEGFSGFLKKDAIWGAYPGERVK